MLESGLRRFLQSVPSINFHTICGFLRNREATGIELRPLLCYIRANPDVEAALAYDCVCFCQDVQYAKLDHQFVAQMYLVPGGA